MIKRFMRPGLLAVLTVLAITISIVVIAVVGWGVWAFISDEDISTEIIVADANNCLVCHGNPELFGIDYVAEEAMKTSAHGVFDCVICHSSKKSLPHEDTAVQLSLTEKCSSCHKSAGEQYLTSIHGENEVATCVDCHSPDESPHSVTSIVSAAAYSAADYKKSIAETCGKCHAEVYDSYSESFHGKAMELATLGQIAFKNYATCTSCHGVHDLKAVSDPVSPVGSLVNLTATCEKCHTGAGVEFASSYASHEEVSPENMPVAYYVEIFMHILVISVLSFGAFVVLAAFIRFSINRWRE